jgi:vitamin B12 transporter
LNPPPHVGGYDTSPPRWSLNTNLSVGFFRRAQLKDQRMKKIVSSVLAGSFAVGVGFCQTTPSRENSTDTVSVTNQTGLRPIVVTATRIPTLPENTSSPVTVISREEILASQQRLVADVLRGEPGLDVARTGQPGSLTSVFLRGANNSHTLVLVDGIRVNSPFNNAFDFSQLAVDDIEQIEILRGPQSTLYGSEALGGVINIVTKRGSAQPTGSLEVDYGSFDTLLTRGSFAASEKKFSIAGDASYASTDNDHINSDYHAVNLSARARYDFSTHFSASLLATYLNSDAGTPNDRFTNDPNDRTKNDNFLVGLTLEAEPTAWWSTKLVLSHALDRIDFSQPAPNPPFTFPDYASRSIAERNQLDFQNIFTFAGKHKILLGGTFEDATAKNEDNYSALDHSVDTRSAYVQYEFSPVARVTLNAGGRVDDFSSFGTHGTYRFGGRFTAPRTETIIRANAGTGFRAPSISQLYYPVYGNADLKPEESFGWDMGLEQPFAHDKFRVGATFFHNDFDNLISGFPPANVNRARTMGLETFAGWSPLTNLTLRASYTWLDTEYLATGLQLERRPEHRGSFGVDWKILPQLAANANLLVVGQRADSDFSSFPSTRVTLPSYTKFDLGLRWRATKSLEIFGRAENLLDEKYEEVFGFPALGRFFSAGVIAKF